jgi:hypothetical protein
MPRFGALCLAFGLAIGAPAAGDPWDGPALRDDGPDTLSELAHGSDEVHDLRAKAGQPDEDWFRIRQEPYASYEVVVDAAVGDVTPIALELIGADGTTALATSAAIGLGAVRSLRFVNATSTAVDDQLVVVRSGGCTKCKKDDTYRLRAYETTYAIPRYNNSGSQVTVLILQNPTDHAVAGNVHFWNAAGALLHTEPFAVDPKFSFVGQTQTFTNLAGTSGSITITHDGRYGDLHGKTSGLEPATGFLFESPLEPRARD